MAVTRIEIGVSIGRVDKVDPDGSCAANCGKGNKPRSEGDGVISGGIRFLFTVALVAAARKQAC